MQVHCLVTMLITYIGQNVHMFKKNPLHLLSVDQNMFLYMFVSRFIIAMRSAHNIINLHPSKRDLMDVKL